jgi:hypothetical protein
MAVKKVGGCKEAVKVPEMFKCARRKFFFNPLVPTWHIFAAYIGKFVENSVLKILQFFGGGLFVCVLA